MTDLKMYASSKSTITAVEQKRLPKYVHLIVFCCFVCVQNSHSHQSHNLTHDVIEDGELNHDHNHAEIRNRHNIGSNIWLASAGSIAFIVVCDVFAVLLVPLMQKVFYQHIIQFLIALAIGSLLGDAILHLIPHALLHDLHSPNVSPKRIHEKSVWLGFAAVVSLKVFFCFEGIIKKVNEWHERRKMERKTMAGISLEPQRNSIIKEHIRAYKENITLEVDTVKKETIERLLEAQEFLDVVLKMVNENEKEESRYGHGHNHSHAVPDSISSVAWMLLLGDGIHSLADGLAIGAAFSDSMTSGLSTAIAVLCHELPHKVGDFAMLLRAGMSIKQAIVCMLLSSVLSYIGMVIGILLGELEMLTPWILIATAGIFIYVALVDMMPELIKGHGNQDGDHSRQNSNLLDLCLRMMGMSLGTFIMLIIALNEESLSTLISESESSPDIKVQFPWDPLA